MRRSAFHAQLPFLVLTLPLLAIGCGAKRFTPPSGPGAPFPDYAAAFEQATEQCRGVKTITATLAVSGRTGATKLRGRVDAGFASPGQARLEGRAPFGRPVFILVARDDSTATLVLPRDNRVLRDAAPAAIVEALTGVALNPDELRSAIAGCGFGSPSPSGGRTYGQWVAIDSANGTTQYVRRMDGRWRLVASNRGPLTIEYRDFNSDRPGTVRMHSASGTSETDLTVRLSDVALNTALGADVFKVEIPPGADPLTLDELRRTRIPDR